MTKEEENVIEAARNCAYFYYMPVLRDKLPKAMAELESALKKYELTKRS